MRKMINICSCFASLLILSLSSYVYGNGDSDALIALKNALSDPDNELASWDPTSVNPCTWPRITCNADDRVTRVSLGGCNLGGNLAKATALGNLDQLQYLNLDQNNLEGSVPAEIGNLENLIGLSLYTNKLTGTIPPLGHLTSLSFLRLFNNKITGPIPTELAGLANLQEVDLSNNDLCGTVPPGLEHIQILKLENNPRLGTPGACP